MICFKLIANLRYCLNNSSVSAARLGSLDPPAGLFTIRACKMLKQILPMRMMFGVPFQDQNLHPSERRIPLKP